MFTSKLWPLPLAGALVSAIVAFVVADIRVPAEATFATYLWPGDAKAASDMLSFIAGTSMTVLTTTISMTLIVLQVASGNFSHQLLRDYIQSPAVRGIVTVYVSVFTYAVLVLRSLDSDQKTPPQLAVTISVILVFLALGTFIWYVSRVVDMVRVDTIINASVKRTLEYSDDVAEADNRQAYPRPQVPDHARRITADKFGYIQKIDLKPLTKWAEEYGATVVVDVRPGDRVISGQTVARYWFDPETAKLNDVDEDLDTEEYREQSAEDVEQTPPSFLYLDLERVSGEDFSLGLRQLLDIGVRALSPGTNDPTTARHVIGQSASALRELVLDAPQPTACFEEVEDQKEEKEDQEDKAPKEPGRLVLWAAVRTPAEMINAFSSQFRRYGSKEPGVLIDLLQTLELLEDSTKDPELLNVIADQRKSIVAAAKRDLADELDLQSVLHAVRADSSLHEPPPDEGV
ncbi:hypothetical protein BSR29_05545 [Boudabousia liubingyangii]|uniref:DUF2254 domain-containing protein n=2 Tax=Boudabousia liubingyangii TaxID=1921764 RepID=A0A1Q5PLK7_9ACTO|nr:hypothetical protein BSR28_05860 [Boudabousia liubingyangii]OKL47944.1 hypothetical protein BSR29_05545 [Boudabousia liubingyangii]